MSLAVNHCVIGGNVTRDPEVKVIGTATVAKFSIAINEKYKANDGTMKETVAFVDCECWNKTAELVSQYVHQGDRLIAEGRLKSDSWQTQDGQKRQKLLLRADRVHFIGPKRDESAPADAPTPKKVAMPVATDADEPPF